MIQCRYRSSFSAIQWTGAESELREAQAALAPRFNVIRYADPLQGDCLRVMYGDLAWMVPAKSWLIICDHAIPNSLPFVLSEPYFQHIMDWRRVSAGDMAPASSALSAGDYDSMRGRPAPWL